MHYFFFCFSILGLANYNDKERTVGQLKNAKDDTIQTNTIITNFNAEVLVSSLYIKCNCIFCQN